MPVPVFNNTDTNYYSVYEHIGKLKFHQKFTVLPVTRREIYLVHNSHNDIGYSDIQENVEKLQDKNIRDALKLIEKTKDYPDGSKFVWNIES